MARKRRVHYPGAVYHVMLRGNGGHEIFFDGKISGQNGKSIDNCLGLNGAEINLSFLKNCNYSGTPIFEYNTDFIGLILKTEKFEYLILKFNKPMISMNYVYKNSGITKS